MSSWFYSLTFSCDQVNKDETVNFTPLFHYPGVFLFVSIYVKKYDIHVKNYLLDKINAIVFSIMISQSLLARDWSNF